MFFKVQNVVDIRAAELINRLVIITDHAKVLVLACQRAHQFELRRIRILVLIHHDVAEALLIVV